MFSPIKKGKFPASSNVKGKLNDLFTFSGKMYSNITTRKPQFAFTGGNFIEH